MILQRGEARRAFGRNSEQQPTGRTVQLKVGRVHTQPAGTVHCKRQSPPCNHAVGADHGEGLPGREHQGVSTSDRAAKKPELASNYGFWYS